MGRGRLRHERGASSGATASGRTSGASRRASGRRISTTGRIRATTSPRPSAAGGGAPPPQRRARPGGAGQQEVHPVLPRSFNDAQQVADKFKDGIPVSSTCRAPTPTSRRGSSTSSSGLTYALNGGTQRVADKVFLLTPRNVEVSAEERARKLLERAASSTRRNSARHVVPAGPASGRPFVARGRRAVIDFRYGVGTRRDRPWIFRRGRCGRGRKRRDSGTDLAKPACDAPARRTAVDDSLRSWHS